MVDLDVSWSLGLPGPAAAYKKGATLGGCVRRENGLHFRIPFTVFLYGWLAGSRLGGNHIHQSFSVPLGLYRCLVGNKRGRVPIWMSLWTFLSGFLGLCWWLYKRSLFFTCLHNCYLSASPTLARLLYGKRRDRYGICMSVVFATTLYLAWLLSILMVCFGFRDDHESASIYHGICS